MWSKTGIAVGLATALLPFQTTCLRQGKKLVGKPEPEEYEPDLQNLVDKFRDKGMLPTAAPLPEIENPEKSEEEMDAADVKSNPNKPHPRWGRLAPANPNLRNAATYWGHITCQDPHEIDIGIRMKVNQYPGNITFSVFPWQFIPFQFFGHKRDPLGVNYCRAVTTCTAEYTLNVVSPNSTNFSMSSNPDHLDAATGSHVLYDQCEWPTIGLEGHFKSNVEFIGDLKLTGHLPGQRTMFKARTDLGDDSTIPYRCKDLEEAIKGTSTIVGGYLSCNKFWLRKCVETEPQGHEWAVYMIKTASQSNGDWAEPRLTLMQRNYSYNMMFNPILWVSTQNTRANQLVTVVWMPPTLLALDTYLYGLHTLGGNFEVKLDPGLMSAHHQRKMDRSLFLAVLANFSGPDVTSLTAQYSSITSFCHDGGEVYPEKMYLQSTFHCGVDPSEESITANGDEEKRLWGWKQRMKAYNHRRVLVISHEYFFSDAGLGGLMGGTVEAAEVRVLSENNLWRIPSDPHCWDGQP